MKTDMLKEGFYSEIFRLVLPIAVQNLITTAVNSADVIMLGYVSQTALSASSLANQIQFILTLLYAGMSSGTIMLAAQYWGKKDTVAIEKIMGIALRLSIGISILFAVGACFFPRILMLIFTSDEQLIAAGVEYLRIVGISYLFMGISQIYLCVMRSIERVVFSTIVNGTALVLNIVLNAILIFGLFGLPAMGIAGAALATTIARGVELALCLINAAFFKTVRLRIACVFERNPVLFQDFLRYSLPAFGNELVWGVGFSMYSVIMGHLGSDIVAANSVVMVARNLGKILCSGLSSGGAILLGKEIGANCIEQAKVNARKLYKITILAGAFGGLVIFLLRPVIMQMVSLTDTAMEYLNIMTFINVYYIIGVAVNTVFICGIFRSGGDSRYGFLCDTIDMWLFSVPLGFLNAFVFNLPPMIVYFVICLDEFVKIPFVYHHYKSYRWLKNITRENV